MTKRERINAALKGEQTDRVPYSVYQHSTVHERTVERFVDFTINFHNKYDPDYIKVMYDENYDTPVNWQYIMYPEVWDELEPLDPHTGGFGRQLEALKRIKERAGAEVPVLQTVYSPLHFSHRLTNRRLLEDWKKSPQSVLRGLDIIAENTARFAECALREAGIDGFFFGAYGCERDWMSEETYRSLAMNSDLKTLKALRKGEMLFVHIHGEKDSFFNLLKDYPGDALSWEDRLAGPSLKEARRVTDKCLIGGIDHLAAVTGSPEEIMAECRQSVRETGGRGLILAPGCTFPDGTPEANMLALKEAVSRGR